MKNNIKKLILVSLIGISLQAKAETINTLVEFFSFTCVHCASVNRRLTSYVAKHNIKYLDIDTNMSDEAMPTNIMYYIAVDSGVGVQFKEAYFKAVSSGMVAFSPSILSYVTNQVKNDAMARLMQSDVEKTKIKQKLEYVKGLLSKYHIEVTPTFLINQTTLLEGEDVINSLIGDTNG